MDSATAGRDAAPVFSAVLTPYRSLSPRGFLLVMAGLAAASFVAGAIFWAIGAWPVPGFLGLDVLLVYVAFRLNYRAAGAAEEISLTRERLTVRRIAADGRASAIDLNPYWVRLEIDRRPGLGITGLRLASHGRRHPIGGFLGPDERETFAAALAAALAEARATPVP
jgi:uncharacterized membrane protein